MKISLSFPVIFFNKNPGKEWDLKQYLKDNYDKLHNDLDD